MVNFYLPKHGDLDAIVYTWQAYADSVAAHSDWHPFSYLNNSYHRDTDMNNIIDCATCLLLSPGAVQIFYGDESRRGLSDARLNVDSDQAFRSDMNWETADSAVHEHFKRLEDTPEPPRDWFGAPNYHRQSHMRTHRRQGDGGNLRCTQPGARDKRGLAVCRRHSGNGTIHRRKSDSERWSCEICVAPQQRGDNRRGGIAPRRDRALKKHLEGRCFFCSYG